MLKEALNGNLPLIEIQTGDIAHVEAVIEYYAKPKGITVYDLTDVFEENDIKDFAFHIVYIPSESLDKEWHTIYTSAAKKNASVIVVNPTKPVPMAFKVNELPIPADLVKKVVREYKGNYIQLQSVLSGLSLKEINEVLSIATSKYRSKSKKTILKVRAEVVPLMSKGLSPVDIDEPFYMIEPRIAKWAEFEKPFFFKAKDSRLRAKGILLNGDAGVGKSMAAKYIAQLWGVACYRLDVGSLLGKYHGESEGHLESALLMVDREEPCILLLDEVEKMFASGDDTGVIDRMYAKLLWWMQERKSKVLAVLTSNDMTKLRPELYRKGRIDLVHTIKGLNHDNAFKFVGGLLDTFNLEYEDKDVLNILKVEKRKADKEKDAHKKIHSIYNQASLSYAVCSVVKANIKELDNE